MKINVNSFAKCKCKFFLFKKDSKVAGHFLPSNAPSMHRIKYGSYLLCSATDCCAVRCSAMTTGLSSCHLLIEVKFTSFITWINHLQSWLSSTLYWSFYKREKQCDVMCVIVCVNYFFLLLILILLLLVVVAVVVVAVVVAGVSSWTLPDGLTPERKLAPRSLPPALLLMMTDEDSDILILPGVAVCVEKSQ